MSNKSAETLHCIFEHLGNIIPPPPPPSLQTMLIFLFLRLRRPKHLHDIEFGGPGVSENHYQIHLKQNKQLNTAKYLNYTFVTPSTCSWGCNRVSPWSIPQPFLKDRPTGCDQLITCEQLLYLICNFKKGTSFFNLQHKFQHSHILSSVTST